MDRLVAAAYGLAHEPEGHLPATTRALRAFLDGVRGDVERLARTLPGPPSEPELLSEWRSIERHLKTVRDGVWYMEMLARNVDTFQTLFKNLIYR